jgi:hypothetical protein
MFSASARPIPDDTPVIKAWIFCVGFLVVIIGYIAHIYEKST